MQSFFPLFLLFSLIFTSWVFYAFSNPCPCLSGFVEIPVPSKFCVWKGWASPSAVQHMGQAGCVHCLGLWQVPLWNVLGVSSSWAAVADQGKVGLRLQWGPPYTSDLVSYPASDRNFLWRPGKVAGEHCLRQKGWRLQYVSILNIFQFWNEASEKRVHKQEKMWRIRICMWLTTFLWFLPELMLHRIHF